MNNVQGVHLKLKTILTFKTQHFDYDNAWFSDNHVINLFPVVD